MRSTTTTQLAVALITVASSATADVMTNGAFSYGSGHGSFAAHSGHGHKHGQYHKNPWKHTVIHHKTANEYHKDPWIGRNSIDNKDNRRDGWYSPYQQFSPPQIQYKPSVSEATFATCRLTGVEGTNTNMRIGGPGDSIVFAQMKGKAIIVKRNFCHSRQWNNDTTATEYTNRIMQTGIVEEDDDGNDCTLVGEEFNPLEEVDQFGRDNPFQDPNRGTMPNFTTQIRGATTNAFPTCVANEFPNGRAASGYEDLEPFSLLQNLEGADGIMGRAVIINREDSGSIRTCCIIAREEAPIGFGPKPVPFPLTTHSKTYNSYGTEYAVPLPYHKHGYQATAGVDILAGNPHYAASPYLH